MYNYLNPSLNHHISIYCINQYKNKPSGLISMLTTYPNTRSIVYWSSQISFTLKSFRNLILSPHMLVYSLNSKERNLLTIAPNPPEFSPVTLDNAFFSNVTRTSSPLMRRLAGTQEPSCGSYQFHTQSHFPAFTVFTTNPNSFFIESNMISLPHNNQISYLNYVNFYSPINTTHYGDLPCFPIINPHEP